MSRQTEVLREVIAQFNRGVPVEVERFFTPEFVLDYPTSGVNRSGLAGARDMCEGMAKVGENVQLEVLHMLEQNNHVAVRYQATWQGANPGSAALIGIYRFVGGKIAADWGLSAGAPWST